MLDLAESLAEKAGISTVQDYCAQLLERAIHAERVRQKVAEVEAVRGPLEGLNEIASDPDYLAEWHARSEVRSEQPSADKCEVHSPAGIAAARVHLGISDAGDRNKNRSVEATDETRSVPATCIGADEGGDGTRSVPGSSIGADELAGGTRNVPGMSIGANSTMNPATGESSPQGDFRPRGADEPPEAAHPPEGSVVVAASKPGAGVTGNHSSLEILWRHVAPGEDDWAFLPCLRRGVPVPANKAAELIRALKQLESEHRGAQLIDRRTAHALHRLALESQVLLTDAWPGVFDETMIATIRVVQEAVERILSGQDIRYYPRAQQPTAEPRR
jgi:hypothetical protein